ncbi:MAG: hypothetical protein HOW97_02425 [Catenulispora sp.]|nr:hypothetical protein [Catenulispora sp.]
MTPRPAGCDGPDCFLGDSGWLHYPDCATQQPPAPWPDMAAETALEDGVYRRTQTTTPERSAA